MPRETLDRKLLHLHNEILEMDSMVEQAILNSVDALKNRDMSLADDVIQADSYINKKRFELENEIVITIATAQPIMAGDLRQIASIFEIVSELERMGDYAKGIARIALRLGNEPPVKPLVDIPRMTEITVSMLHRAITAFIERDVEASRTLPAEDDQVDDLYNQIYRELITIMFRDPSLIDRANMLLWVAHNLERVADRVTNICERTIYMVTGELTELSVSDDEMISER